MPEKRGFRAFFDLQLFGGAAGYCLRVRTVTGIWIYVRSFLFYLGGYYQLQKTKLINAIASCRATLRYPDSLITVVW